MEQSVRIIWYIGVCYLQQSVFKSGTVAGYGQCVDRSVYTDLSGDVSSKVAEYLLDQWLDIAYIQPVKCCGRLK